MDFPTNSHHKDRQDHSKAHRNIVITTMQGSIFSHSHPLIKISARLTQKLEDTIVKHTSEETYLEDLVTHLFLITLMEI